MQLRFLLFVSGLWLSMTGLAAAQFKEGDPKGTKTGEATVQKWQCGVIINATSGPCTGLKGYVPVPIDWPEQQVRVLEEDISPLAKINYEMVEGTSRVMTISVPQLPAGQQAKALVTFEVHRSPIIPPENTESLVLPDPKKLPREIRPFLAPSPLIETKHPKVRAAAREAIGDKAKAWEKVEAIYDWVRERVKYQKGPIKGALAGLNDGTGDCEEMTSLFIAICRINDIPARTVWVPDHCYPEFYLLDEEGNGHWFPCQAAGSRAFGGIPEVRPILQKGDNFRPPYNRKEHKATCRSISPAPAANPKRSSFTNCSGRERQ